MAGLAFSVLEIDGVPVPAPVTEAQIEGLIDRLGDEGLAAIANVIKDEYPTSKRGPTWETRPAPRPDRLPLPYSARGAF